MPDLSGSATADLGFGADLIEQVRNESDDERKKRLKAQQTAALTGASPGAAAQSLLGMGGGGY